MVKSNASNCENMIDEGLRKSAIKKKTSFMGASGVNAYRTCDRRD
jgi:hypothetical protein